LPADLQLVEAIPDGLAVLLRFPDDARPWLQQPRAAVDALGAHSRRVGLLSHVSESLGKGRKRTLWRLRTHGLQVVVDDLLEHVFLHGVGHLPFQPCCLPRRLPTTQRRSPMSKYKLGYARVSTLDQDPALQQDALTAAGCDRIFVDKASGKLESRPALDDLLEQARPGDTVVVWRLDRLGRSLKHLLETVSGSSSAASRSSASPSRSTPAPPAAG
jgi:hypothetical protein